MKLKIVCWGEFASSEFIETKHKLMDQYPSHKERIFDIAIEQGDISRNSHGAIQYHIFSGEYDVVLSPGNSYGMLTGGVDLVMAQCFGTQLEVRLADKIANDHNGMLPIGEAVALRTVNPHCPWFVSAPTMELPSVITDTSVIFRAMAAARHACQRIQNGQAFALSVVTPCFGTGTGKVPPAVAAEEMIRGWIFASTPPWRAPK